MLDPHWVFLALALSLFGAIRYSMHTIRGLVRPNLVSWALWAAAPLIGFFAQLDAGVGMPALQTLGAGLAPLIVFITALLSRHSRVRVTVFDIGCGVCSLVALGVWIGLGQAVYAVFLAIVADGLAALPTFRKVWHDPRTESSSFFALIAVGSAVTLCTVTSWEPAVWAFSAYILVLSLALVLFISVLRLVRSEA